MSKAVAFLQNAWSRHYVGKTWPRDSWLESLHKSRSGVRLRALESAAAGCQIWYDNTTPVVGDSPNSIVPPDLQHVARVIEEQQPDFLIALGKQAAGVLLAMKCKQPLLCLCHPTYRVMTNELYQVAGIHLVSGFTGVVRLAQVRGKVEVFRE